MKRAIKIIFNLILHLGAIVALAWIFWPFVNQAIRAFKLTGFDSEQFIFMARYFRQYLTLPPAGWDHLGYEGTPRVLDTAFSHYYLIQPLVAKLGLNLATKAYPVIWLAIFFLLSYLILFLLSKNQLIALALTAGLVRSQNIYLQIYENGVVLSGLFQTIFPLMLLFLILFIEKKNNKYLILAAIALALQFYSHGAMALVFGFAPAMLFLFFSRFEKEKWLSWERIRRLLAFTLVTLSVGALAILPQVLDSFKGGIYSQFPKAQVLAEPYVFHLLWWTTNPALFVAFGLGIIAAILFFKKQKFARLIIPLAILLIYVLIFQTAMFFGNNPIGHLLFPVRAFWFFSLILAAIAAALFAPLTPLLEKKPLWLLLLSLIVFVTIGRIALTQPLDITKLVGEPTRILPDKNQRDQALFSFYQERLAGIWDQVDHQDTNVRVWLHDFPKIYWNIISPVPQAEGYFHYYTKQSTDWHAWLFATLAEETVENQTIPQDMAEKQALFLIDWYAIKYLIPFLGPEFNLAPRFWGENEYILKKSAEGPPAVLTVKPEFTSGIVEAVNVPLVGFVGSDEGYDAFLRDLGMLNLNTHYLIPLRLTHSIDKLAKTDLDRIDLLVLYNFKGGGNWRKLADFVKRGGSLFIETGGNPSLREGTNLPEVFPAEQLESGSLGRNWQVETREELSVIDFSKLEPLVFKGEPWKVSYVPDPSLVRKGSKILASQAGKPVVVEYQIGQGKIIWSGLNSWYRPWEFKANGMVEVQVLDVILTKLLKTSYHSAVEVKVNREKPEKITVEGSNFSGLVFKENHLPGWKAWVNVSGKKQNLNIYAAGPDLMYLPLPRELGDKPVEVSLTYQGPWLYWFLFFVSILSFILVIIEIITPGFLSKRLGFSRIGRILDPERHFKTITGWWEKEEE